MQSTIDELKRKFKNYEYADFYEVNVFVVYFKRFTRKLEDKIDYFSCKDIDYDIVNAPVRQLRFAYKSSKTIGEKNEHDKTKLQKQRN